MQLLPIGQLGTTELRLPQNLWTVEGKTTLMTSFEHLIDPLRKTISRNRLQKWFYMNCFGIKFFHDAEKIAKNLRTANERTFAARQQD